MELRINNHLTVEERADSLIVLPSVYLLLCDCVLISLPLGAMGW